MSNFYFIDTKGNKTYETSAYQWIGDDGELLDLWFKPKISQEKFHQKKFSLWRYLEFLPLNEAKELVSLGEPITPLVEITFLNGFTAKIKQDQLFPTGSYKYRGAAVLICFLKMLGAKHILQDSSGNAGASIAAYAAQAGITCEIFLPADTAPNKILQMQAYGAKIRKIEGDRAATAKAALIAAKGKVYASHSYNPVFFQGTKTFAYELIEQLNFIAPKAVVLPAGNGTLLLGCYIGFSEMYESGLISQMPKLVAVQTSACNPLYRKFFGLNPMEKINKTLAEGIAIPDPIRGEQMLEAVKKTGGTFISVKEEEIGATWKELAAKGFFIEPTSAATIAGLLKYAANTADSSETVSLFSGNGLKSSDKINQIIFNS